MDFEKIVFDLVSPIVDNKDALSVKVMPTLDDNEILIHVYADKGDVARLIGRRGAMASDITQLVRVSARDEDKRINVRFETY